MVEGLWKVVAREKEKLTRRRNRCKENQRQGQNEKQKGGRMWGEPVGEGREQLKES